jgi:hypothetical protein
MDLDHLVPICIQTQCWRQCPYLELYKNCPVAVEHPNKELKPDRFSKLQPEIGDGLHDPVVTVGEVTARSQKLKGIHICRLRLHTVWQTRYSITIQFSVEKRPLGCRPLWSLAVDITQIIWGWTLMRALITPRFAGEIEVRNVFGVMFNPVFQ